MIRHKPSPIFSQSYDFILWLLHHTESFPKSERFRLARRLEDSAFEFNELLMKANRRTKRKQATLLDADLTLEKLQLYIRISHDRDLTTDKQYQYASKKLLEIGKLLGGWLSH